MVARKTPKCIPAADQLDSNSCSTLVAESQSLCRQTVPHHPDDIPGNSQPSASPPQRLDISGKNAYLRAAARGSEAEFLRLLGQRQDSSTDVNVQDFSKRTALMLSCIAGSQRIVQSLLDNKLTRLDCQDMSGLTALMHAAQRGHWSIVEQLLKRGANHRLQDTSGNTAIILAARRNQVSCLEAMAGFITSDGDWTVEGEFGLTAEQWAEKNGRKEAAEFIRNLRPVANCRYFSE